MRKFILSILLIASLTTPITSINCAGKLGPDASAQAQVNLMKLNVASAVDDAVDGIIAAHTATWLNDNDTVLVLKALHVVLETIRTSPDPKTAVQSAITDIKRQLSASSLVKWNPYLDSLNAVVGAF